MGEPVRYREGLLARIRQTTDDLEWITASVADADLRRSPGADEWSAHEHLSHVRDMDREVILPLLRWATLPDMLGPRPYSRREWHQRRYYEDELSGDILADIRRMRDEEIDIFEALTPEAWERYLPASALGPVTCEWIAEFALRHGLDHLQCVMSLAQEHHLTRRAERMVVIGASA
jgi:hypothetical protein